jgi:acetyl esterase/lipase
MTLSRPALDPELARLLAQLPTAPALDADTLPLLRQYRVPAEAFVEGRSVERQELTIAAADGAELPLSVFRPAGRDATDAAPCIYWLHGGGMVMGDRFANLDIPLEWLERFGAVVVTLDYRLAPEAGGASLVEDCYAGLEWTATHAADHRQTPLLARHA